MSLNRTSDTQIQITRAFPAPPDVVFDAWTRPELVRKWWAPKSRGVEVIECEADVRPGGRYRYVLGGRDMPIAFSGKYIEVERPHRLVYTQVFEPMADSGFATIEIRFEGSGETTVMHATETYPSKEALDGAIESGMEDGANETYVQLDALVAELCA